MNDELERHRAIRQQTRVQKRPLSITCLFTQVSACISSHGHNCTYVWGRDVREDDPLDAAVVREHDLAVSVAGEPGGQDGRGGGGVGREGRGDVGERGPECADAVEALDGEPVEAFEGGIGDDEAEGAVGAGGGEECKAGGEDGELHVGVGAVGIWKD